MESAVADALSSGVAWNDLGPLKTEARKLTWNKSSWSRAVREVSPAGEVMPSMKTALGISTENRSELEAARMESPGSSGYDCPANIAADPEAAKE